MSDSKRGTITHRPVGQWETIRQIRGANRAAGDRWFDPDTCAAFGTRVHQAVYGGRYFVTSERDPYGTAWDGKRRYTVRRAFDNARIVTVGEFGQYATAREAHEAARKAAEGDRA